MPEPQIVCAPSGIAINAAILLLMKIEKKYLLDQAQPAADIIRPWLRNSSFSSEQRYRFALILNSFEPINMTVSIERGETEADKTLIYNSTMRNLLAAVILALQDMPGSDADKQLRFRTFEQINQSLIDSIPVLNAESVQVLWAHALDGREGYFLPMTVQDCILASLRTGIKNILQEQFNCIVNDQELDDQQRIAFDKPFRELFLPWILNNRMPDGLLTCLLTYDLKTPIVSTLARLGVYADDQIEQWLTKDSLQDMACDFTPFLATLHTWMQQHASFFIRMQHARLAESSTSYPSLFLTDDVPNFPITPNNCAAMFIIDWLCGGFSTLPASATRTRDDIALFYQFAYAFHQLSTYEQIVLYDIEELLPPGPIKSRFLTACEILRRFDLGLLPGILLSGQFPPGLMTTLKHFEAGYIQWRQVNQADFISAFFQRWNQGSHPWYTQARSELFVELSRLYFLEQPKDGSPGLPLIRVKDNKIAQWLNTSRAPAIYLINRILLHALCYPPLLWSEVFFKGLQYVLHLHTLQHYESQPQMEQFQSLCAVYRKKIPLELFKRKMDTLAWVVAPELASPSLSVLTNEYLMLTPGLDDAFFARIMDPASGFDPFQLDNDGNTLLIRCAARGSVKQFSILLASGCDPDYISPQGITALHAAVDNDNQAIIDLLITRGVNLNVKDGDGDTPLMIAQANRNTMAEAKLLRAGAVNNTALLAPNSRFFTQEASSSQTKGKHAGHEQGTKFQRTG